MHAAESVPGIAEPRAGHILANPDFVRMWVGQVAASLGNGVSVIATPQLVLALTDSPALAGLVAAARTAPYLVLGLPAGALIDRWNRRVILICCDVARGLAVGSIPVAWWLGELSTVQLIGVALIQGVAVTFSNVAQTASMPRLVRKEQIATAQAFHTSSTNVAALVGPGLGGIVIGLGRTTVEGAVLAFLIDALTHVVSTSMLVLVRTPFQGARGGGSRRLRDEIVEGLRYLWADRPIRLLAIVNMVHRVCVGTVVVLPVVVLARSTLGADPAAIGLIVGAAGAGGLLGSAITPPMRRRLPVGWHMVLTLAIHAVGIGLVGLAGSATLAIVGMVVVGAAEAMTSIVQVSYRLATIPDALQGRVNSVYRMGSFAAMTTGTTVAGLLIEANGARVTLWIMATYVGLIALGVARSAVRRL